MIKSDDMSVNYFTWPIFETVHIVQLMEMKKSLKNLKIYRKICNLHVCDWNMLSFSSIQTVNLDAANCEKKTFFCFHSQSPEKKNWSERGGDMYFTFQKEHKDIFYYSRQQKRALIVIDFSLCKMHWNCNNVNTKKDSMAQHY